ncbi:hypothetical protein [Bartonella sp. B30(2025)]
MKKPIFINSDEILLVMCRDELENIAQSGPFYEEKDIIKFIDNVENAVKIFRIEPTINRCENISEDIAELYINGHDIIYLENKTYHDFILESEAYHNFLDDIVKQEYEDALYGTYEQQHRLRFCDVI